MTDVNNDAQTVSNKDSEVDTLQLEVNRLQHIVDNQAALLHARECKIEGLEMRLMAHMNR